MGDDRVESLLSSFFVVELNGIECGKFSRCEGLEAETYIYEVEEGGFNSGTHKFFGRTRYPNIVLENGITENNDLFDWYCETLSEDKVERKDGSIILRNSADEEVKRWDFFRAIPCRWVGPTLASNMNGCAVEKIEIAIEELKLQ